jgi:hypothetical protein
MIDEDLAAIYGVQTKQLNQQVRRNAGRFPPDFVFRLTPDEASNLRSPIAISGSRWGGRRYQPLVFTEHGAVMLAAVLNSPRAVHASVLIARAFVRLRRLAFGRRELSVRLKELERRVGTHDGEIQNLFNALGAMIEGPNEAANRIGFQP